MLDLDNLLKGNDYTELPQTYIIFLCMKDPFGLNLPVYHKHSFIDPDNRHSYDDKTKKIFYNAILYESTGNILWVHVPIKKAEPLHIMLWFSFIIRLLNYYCTIVTVKEYEYH